MKRANDKYYIYTYIRAYYRVTVHLNIFLARVRSTSVKAYQQMISHQKRKCYVHATFHSYLFRDRTLDLDYGELRTNAKQKSFKRKSHEHHDFLLFASTNFSPTSEV